MKSLPAILLAFFALWPGAAAGRDTGGLYVKNCGRGIVSVWVNGAYQGYLKPGETRYSISDGFITDDSDRPAPGGGKTPVRESHGGWINDGSGKIELTFRYPGGEPQTYIYPPDEQGNVVVGVNETNSAKKPQPPTDIEVENAPAILKGTAPSEYKNPIGDAAATPPQAPTTPPKKRFKYAIDGTETTPPTKKETAPPGVNAIAGDSLYGTYLVRGREYYVSENAVTNSSTGGEPRINGVKEVYVTVISASEIRGEPGESYLEAATRFNDSGDGSIKGTRLELSGAMTWWGSDAWSLDIIRYKGELYISGDRGKGYFSARKVK